MARRPVEELEQEIGYQFKDKDLIDKALTHSSTGRLRNYERLEFLGDRVLGLIVAETLFKEFSEENEGDLAKRFAALVQGDFLADVANRIHLGDYIEFSAAEREAGGAANANILADVFESLIGALYLDCGLETCRGLIMKLLSDGLYEMIAPPQHPKTELQEWAQSQGLPLPLYQIAQQTGPDHAPVFHVSLSVQGYETVIGEGRSRQQAEKEAAQKFLQVLEISKKKDSAA
jgi:ribonuclease-3